MLAVGVTGGMGSGKSTVCRMLSLLGVPVYDSDRRAKTLMVADAELVGGIKKLLGNESYTDSELNRPYISKLIFSDKRLLAQMNELVHPAVARDFERWRREQQADYVVQESAIMFESGFDRFMDRVVVVCADKDVRVRRVVERDGTDEEHVRARMANQMSEAECIRRADKKNDSTEYVIVSDDERLVWPQVLEIDRKLRDESRKQ